MRIIAISDTHGYHRRLTIPEGDMLICAGDFSMRARLTDVVQFGDWFNNQPHEHKIIVCGNHDVFAEGEEHFTRAAFAPAVYLNHEEATIAGYRIFGSPYSGSIYDPSPWAFDYNPRGDRSHAIWSQIPDGIDILITHGPPKGILDRVLAPHLGEDPHVGDKNLLDSVKRSLPRVHIFGHIHEAYGSYESDLYTTKFYNACICDVRYDPINPVTVIDL
jgi:Icc-related predicted phosphoesterase